MVHTRPPLLTNLPPQLTPLVGRQVELGRIAGLLQDPDCRLLTLVGPGGIGKTRLALQAASEQCDVFTHGVFFVPLVGTRSPDLLISSIVEAIDSTFTYRTDARRTSDSVYTHKGMLLDYVREKHMLLVLDNFEHLVTAADFLSELLQNASRIKVLVTSRELLALREEWVFQVNGLDVPDRHPRRHLKEYSAIRLFNERARRTQTDFSLTQHADDVIRICQLLEGMPLGIEQVASLIGALPVNEIAQSIAHDLDLLETPLRDVPERHRSLRVVFEHSWGLLTEAERSTLAKLSVFRGGFQREAAEYVAEVPFRILLGLVNKSMVRLQPSGRYDLHELLREFAAEKLSATPEIIDTAHDRHLMYYVCLIEEAEPVLFSAEQGEALKVSERENGNIRAALTWAHARPTGAEAEYRLVAAMREFWWFYNHIEEGHQWLSNALDREAKVPPPLRVRVLYAHSLLAYSLGRCEESLQSGQSALALCRASGDRKGLPWAFIGTGLPTPDPRQGIALLKEGLATARETGDRPAILHLLLCLGTRIFELAQDQPVVEPMLAAEAIQCFEEVITLSREIGSRWDAEKAYDHQTRIWLELGEFAQANTTNDAGLALAHEIGINIYQIAENVVIKGNIARAQSDYTLAKSCYANAIDLIMAEQGQESQIPLHFIIYLACSELGLGDLVQARTLLEQGLCGAWTNKDHPSTAWVLTFFAMLYSVSGQAASAAKIAGVAETYMKQFHGQLQSVDKSEYHRVMAAAYLELGEESFAAVYAEGSQMSLDEAVAFVLDEAVAQTHLIRSPG